MKCFNCGKECTQVLCEDCIKTGEMGRIVDDFIVKSKNTDEYGSFLDLISLFDPKESSLYYGEWYNNYRDEKFEEIAIAYLQEHDLKEQLSQRVLNDLLYSYIPNDFDKPQKWCEKIAETDELCIELYEVAAKYFAMIGEYDAADTLTDKALEMSKKPDGRTLYAHPYGTLEMRLNKQKEDTLRYRIKKPYWPRTEERRRAVAKYYDAKGIEHPPLK